VISVMDTFKPKVNCSLITTVADVTFFAADGVPVVGTDFRKPFYTGVFDTTGVATDKGGIKSE
jgi:hypothetical protein